MIKRMLNDLVQSGNVQNIYNNSEKISKYILEILDTPNEELKEDDIENLEYIIEISNILYNQTIDTILLVEDGVYDILLEKLKYFKPDYRVGSIIVPNISNSNNTLLNNKNTNPVLYFDPKYDEERWFDDDIRYPPLRINEYDLKKYDDISSNEYISKRTRNTSHKHLELIGTLDKCKFVTVYEAVKAGVDNDPNVKILERDFFAKYITEGIMDPSRKYTMVLELKYDGVSVEADCTDIVLSARSRGDTNNGKAIDMSPILYGYRFPHVVKPKKTPVGIKFEAIIQYDALERFNKSKGYIYKNARTAIIGVLSSSDANEYRDYITLVPLQLESKIFDGKEILSDRIAELEYLNYFYATKGCPNRYTVISGDYTHLLYQIKKFVEEAEDARYMIPFMYDGIVVSFVDQDIRNLLPRENFVNKYSMAVKFNPLNRITTFRGYTYTIGQDGTITPMIHYDPVEFYGSIHHMSSGHSYNRFNELNLGKGDVLNIKYVNDVMPYVYKETDINPVKEKFPEVCPCCGTTLIISDSNKSVKCPNIDCFERGISRMINTFKKLNIPNFGEQTIRRLNTTHMKDIIDIYKTNSFKDYDFGDIECSNFYNDITNHFNTDIYDYQIFGSIGFDNISDRTWKRIFDNYGISDFLSNYGNGEFIDGIISIKGIGNSILNTILTELPFFIDDLKEMVSMYRNILPSKGTIKKVQVRCTGFRDKELFTALRSIGYDADDNASVTKSTDILLIPYEGFSSSKTSKVGENCKIIPVKEFSKDVSKYL